MVFGVSVVYNRAFPSTESETLPTSDGGKKPNPERNHLFDCNNLLKLVKALNKKINESDS